MTKADLLKYIDERLADPTTKGSVGLLMVRQYVSDQMEEWIPVSERVPDRYWDVLVTVKEKYEDETQYRYHTDVAEHFEGDEWSTSLDWDEGQDVKIAAWMPLPEPWKGEEE